MGLKKRLMFVLVLLCLTSLVTIQDVEAQSTNNIYIHGDGSISGTNKIVLDGNLYTITGDIYDSAMVVECSNIVVDGGGFTLQGAGGWGSAGVSGKESSAAISLTCSNVTIQNFKITGWEVGIYGAFNNNTLTNNFISETRSCIAIYADNYKVTGNYLAYSIDGVLDKGNNDVFSKNWVVNDTEGFLVCYYQSVGHLIVGNRIENNTLAINTYNGQGLEIYHNNFVNNQNNIATLSDAFSAPLSGNGGTLPPWDNGEEGNYWSNYNGVDANHDGIGDTPNIVRNDIYIVDRYPLIAPYNIEKPSITSAFNALSPNSSQIHISNEHTNPQLTTNANTPKQLANNLNQQVILIGIAALAACIAVVITIATFKKQKLIR